MIAWSLQRRMNRLALCFGSLILCTAAIAAGKIDANRLTYLDDNSPFHPHLNFPKLITPQWIGEPGVEAAIVLSIDDMSDSKAYEAFLRPVLERLKQVEGTAPLSIFCNSPNPQDPHLQTWLKEGLSLEAHTLSHPCPLLAKGSFEAAQNTYHGCVDLLNHVAGNKPVAFRMPCCDSMNSPSPRFYFEIFNRVNAAGQFLTIDTSVMNITTTNDPTLPKNLTIDADGKEKFRKYVPFPAFSTTIDDYPYPYQIGKTIWEFPCAVPSDWEGQHLHGVNNPKTVADWKAAIDITVLKQGVFTMVFHPHGWVTAEQVVELIDHAVSKYGRKVKFLNFRQAQELLDRNLLSGQPLRDARGKKNGVQLLDLNNDGFMDVVIGNQAMRKTRVWNPKRNQWNEGDFPFTLIVTDEAGRQRDTDARFGVLQTNGFASVIVHAQEILPGKENLAGAWHFDGGRWVEDKSLLDGLEANGQRVFTKKPAGGCGVRLRDVDNDGRCELIVGNETQNAVFGWMPGQKTWKPLPFALPQGTAIAARGMDNGLRFVDINEDGFDDVLFSNEERFSLHLFVPQATLGFERGWTMQLRSGKRGDPNEIPMIARGGISPNNGAWFRNRHLWVQNEFTAEKPDVVERRSFAELLSLDAPPPKSPEESLAAMKTRPGFKVEIVAAEPLIADPIAFEWGADGRMWVVEMGDYPLGTDGKGKGGGKVRVLEDTDKDGRYDKSTVFLENLDFPTGVFPWGKGVIVSAAPEVFYAEDTDGDGKADTRKTWFTGFHPGNQQHRVNGFVYGLDNWIYGANGDSGGEITSAATGKKVNINGRDFRFRPETGEFQSESGQTQFGRHRDDWGNWFGNNNPTWGWHFLYPERYLVRNSHLPVRETKHWFANYPDNTRVFPASRTIERFNWAGAANHVTSANSPVPYRDELFGPDFTNSLFISEPVHNLVHREVLEARGVTFSSRRAPDEHQSEFLASTDNWFRPAMIKTGPDGALYVADMYRLVIEHPEWIPAERQKRIDLRAGADKGRIYRVYPSAQTLRRIPDLSAMSASNLVIALDSPNGWQRDTAQRLLVERQDKSAIEPLKQLVQQGRYAPGRLQALCALEGLGAIHPEIATVALRDPHPQVRANAIRVSEHILRAAIQRVPLSKLEEFRAALLQLADDPDPKIRFQLAFSLGEWLNRRAGAALAKLALKDWNDPHMQIAIMSSAPRHVGEMLAIIMAEPHPPASLIEQLLGLATAMDDQQAYLKVLGTLVQPAAGIQSWRLVALAGFLDALERRGQSLAVLQQKAQSPGLKQIVSELDLLFHQARTMSEPTAALTNDSPDLLSAIRLLGRGTSQVEEDITQLGALCGSRFSIPVQKEALAALQRINNRRVAETLLRQWTTLGPVTRADAINVLFSRAEWLDALLSAIESGEIPAGQIGAGHQQQLRTYTDQAVKTRAAKLFSANVNRAEVLKQYDQVVNLKGNPARGRELFVQTCAACHRFKEQGNAVGPDLGMMADKPVLVWLTAILDPNQAVEARYISYTAVTQSERELTGIIVTETANSISLRNPAGNEETLLRSDLKELKSSGLSLMPEGLEQALAPQAMADLISYLTSR